MFFPRLSEQRGAIFSFAMFVATILAAPSVADDRRMTSEPGDDESLKEGQLSHDDLLGASGRDEDSEERLRAHLEAARRYVDVQAYGPAMEELEAADRLVPFHEEVTLMLELVGDMQDGAREAEMELSRAEEERRAREAREAMEREAAERQERAAEEVIERRGLPGDLEPAIVELRERQEGLEERRGEARLARERCIGAAARAHAHGAGRQCGEEERELARLQRQERALEADLTVLTSSFRERHGEDALERVLNQDD